MLKRMRQLLLAKRELAGRPNLGILPPPKCISTPPHTQHPSERKEKRLTGFNPFLISVSSVPPLIAITGAASGSCAIGDPHSEQNHRYTALPLSAVPFHFLTGPVVVNLSLGTTTTRARSTENGG